MSLDELESLRLADLEGLYQEQAAARMAISRATFGRIVEAARHKVAEALIRGKSLRIEGGAVHADVRSARRCGRCMRAGEGARCPRSRGGAEGAERSAAPPDATAGWDPQPCGGEGRSRASDSGASRTRHEETPCSSASRSRGMKGSRAR